MTPPHPPTRPLGQILSSALRLTLGAALIALAMVYLFTGDSYFIAKSLWYSNLSDDPIGFWFNEIFVLGLGAYFVYASVRRGCWRRRCKRSLAQHL